MDTHVDTHELLDVLIVNQAVERLGLKKCFVVGECGLSRTTGYAMLRNGVLPSDPARRKQVLRRLAKLLGLTPADLVVRLTGNTEVK